MINNTKNINKNIIENRKKLINLIIIFLKIIITFPFLLYILFSYFISNISCCVKNIFFKIITIIAIITKQYIACGKLLFKLKTPLSEYILCILLSLKNKVFITKIKVIERKNKQILIIYGL